MILAYAEFCDHNNLKRIDATAEEELRNLNLMLLAVARRRDEVVARIDLAARKARVLAEAGL